MQKFHYQGVKFAYFTAGKDFSLDSLTKKEGKNDLPLIIWAHGWGQNHASFMPLITTLESRGHHIAIDFPGFGQSPPPPDDWSTENYANAFAEWIKEQNLPPVLWIGHSFGCRVGTQLAARHPECVQGLVFIAGAGLKRKRPIHKKVYFFCRIKLFKALRKFVPEGNFKNKLMNKFGSTDYKNAGPMRKIFISVVNEDLSEQAEKIQCPTTLIYGQQDTETPPEFGQRYSQLIKGSKLFLLDEQDHYSLLQNGRHQVIKIIDDFIKERNP